MNPSFPDFCILLGHVETSQLNPNNNSVADLCLSYGNAESLTINKNIDKASITENLIVFLIFNFLFYNKFIWRQLILL